MAYRPLKILHLIFQITETNGQYNEHCLPLLNERKISICTFRKSRFTPHHEIAVFEGDGTTRGFARALRAALAAQSYDVIHAHAPHMGVMLLVAAVVLLRLPGTLRRSVYTVQNSYPNYGLKDRLKLIPVFLCFRQIVFCGYACRQSYRGPLARLVRRKAHVVQNGADIDRLDRTIGDRPAERTDGKVLVTAIGRLAAIKNPFTLVRAVRSCSYPALRLRFVGGGDLTPELLEEIARLGLEGRVAITGLVDRDEVYRLASEADLLVSCSRGEGLPVAVVEAMAARCPAILSDIPPHREITRDLPLVPLVAPDDVDGFARAIERFCRLPAEERARLGRECRKLVVDRFGLKTMHEGYERVYSAVAD